MWVNKRKERGVSEWRRAQAVTKCQWQRERRAGARGNGRGQAGGRCAKKGEERVRRGGDKKRDQMVS